MYNQTLIWKLDPWYEAWSRIGSSRRDNVLSITHERVAGRTELRGPGSTRSWSHNTALDPVITDYGLVKPWQGCVVNDGVDHRYFCAHPSMTDSIRDITVCQYTNTVADRPTKPEMGRPIRNPDAKAGANDRLYAFEGATGSIDDLPPAWSLLGIALTRHAADGGYDVHIAYRGSQSGDAYRAAYEGLVLEAGNPDWVTDMEIRKLVTDHRFSTVGKVVRGIRDSVVTSFGSLLECLEDVATTNGQPPRKIHITGHSLGGALATQLAAALTVGNLADALPDALRSWPWADLELRTFGAPKSGDHEFAAHFDATTTARRIWVDGDPIPEFPLNSHVGHAVELGSGFSGTMNHEPFVIRQAMVTSVAWHRPSDLDAPWTRHEPWGAFDSLGDALLAAEANGDEIDTLFEADHTPYTDLFVEIAAAVIESPSSYRSPWTKPRLELRRRARALERAFASPVDSLDGLRRQLRNFRGLQPGSSIEDHLRRIYVIRAAARNGWTATDLLDDEHIAKLLGTHRRPRPTADDSSRYVELAAGPPPNKHDIARVNGIIWMRQKHHEVVNKGSVKNFRRRVPPTSGMPHLVRACSHYPGLDWLPKELMVPRTIPEEAKLATGYKAMYYGLGKLGWGVYARSPIRPEVPWDPSYEWNDAFPETGDGWEHPSSDETFVRLRTQGPNPFMLRKVDDGFELDFSDLFDGVLPPIVARFDLVEGQLVSREISVGPVVHRPGDITWDRAKRAVNAADIRSIPFIRHLLEVHFIVGQAFAVSAYNLPTWHALRPFMHFFSFGTIQVNDFAYQAFFEPSSYFVASGFINEAAAASMFKNRVATFDLDEWIVPKDIENRGLEAISGHPYVADAQLIWPELVGLVERHLDDIGFTSATIASDNDLQAWYLTLAKMLPNTDAQAIKLDRTRLVELLSAFLYNNVVHEVCGDMSPILGSEDPEDKAVINLERLAESIADGTLSTPLRAPSMADVFLMEQASYTSRFNVGGNKILDITADRWVDDPKLSAAIIDLQSTLRRLEAELIERNDGRDVRFSRLLPSNWEASVSF